MGAGRPSRAQREGLVGSFDAVQLHADTAMADSRRMIGDAGAAILPAEVEVGVSCDEFMVLVDAVHPGESDLRDVLVS